MRGVGLQATTPWHRLAGRIIRDEMARQHLTRRKAAAACHMGTATISKAIAGDPSVTDLMLRSIEGGLDLKRPLLDYVIAGDVKRVRELPGMQPDLQQWILEQMAQTAQAEKPQRRRATDR